jgi:hypothetical protein
MDKKHRIQSALFAVVTSAGMLAQACGGGRHTSVDDNQRLRPSLWSVKPTFR